MKNETVAFLLIAIVLLLSASTRAPMELPEPVEHIELPDYLQIQEYDLADYCGELGKLYVVRAEWVYLSAESAEEKRGELCE